MNKKSGLPLMPDTALEYFLDGQADNKLYLRATSIRSCLENVVNTIFIHIIDDGYKEGWRKKTLYNKIEMLSDFFPDEINTRLSKIRTLGNNGAHEHLNEKLIEEDVDITLNDLSQICEWTIYSYFLKNGFSEHPWIPTLFSTLPPIYRIRILERILDSEQAKIGCFEILCYQKHVQDFNEQAMFCEIIPERPSKQSNNEKRLGGFLLLIDKLAMAYLKNKERAKSFSFIDEMYAKAFINDQFRYEMLEKLELLWENIDRLGISENITETRKKITAILPAIKEDEKSLFVTIFTAIISHNR